MNNATLQSIPQQRVGTRSIVIQNASSVPVPEVKWDSGITTNAVFAQKYIPMSWSSEMSIRAISERLVQPETVKAIASNESASEEPAKLAARLVSDLYSLDRRREDRKAAKLIVDKFTAFLNGCRWATCNEVLRQIDISRVSESSVVSLLGITRTAKQKLSSREDFADRAKVALVSTLGEETTDRIMARYR